MRVRATPLRSSMSCVLTPSRRMVLAGVRYRSLKTRAAGELTPRVLVSRLLRPLPRVRGRAGEGEATSTEQAAFPPPPAPPPRGGGANPVHFAPTTRTRH